MTRSPYWTPSDDRRDLAAERALRASLRAGLGAPPRPPRSGIAYTTADTAGDWRAPRRRGPAPRSEAA